MENTGKKILHPGSRGGHGYYDDSGQWQYGVRPFDTDEPLSNRHARTFGVTLYHHLGHVPSPAEVSHEWKARYGADRSTFVAHTIAAAEDAHQAVEYGLTHDEHGYRTTERLRAAVESVTKHPYKISDLTKDQPMAEREKTWEAVAEAITDIHRTLPGLDDFLAKHPLLLSIESATLSGIGVRGEYERPYTSNMPGQIHINQLHARTFVHELGHYIDNMLAVEHPADAWDHRHMATENLPSHPLASMAQQMKATKEHKEWVKTASGKREYWVSNRETFARFFDTWVAHETGKPTSDRYEPYTDEQMQKFSATLSEVLKQGGLIKSLLLAWKAGGHSGWHHEEPLEKKIGKKIILHPGSRGGHGYWDTTGHWQYGEHPVVKIPSITLKDSAERAMTAEDHVMDALNDLGFLDNRQLVAQPVHTEIVVRKHVARAMEQRGYDAQEFKTAWDTVMTHLQVNGGYKTIKWNKDTLDGRIQKWLQNHKVASDNLSEAIVHMPKEMRHKLADDIAEDMPVFSWSQEEGAAERVKLHKQALERIMELRYHLNYEETPEGPPPYQNALPGTESFDANDYSGMDRARAVHEAISASDRFEDIPRHLLPLALAMDPEVGPLLSSVTSRGRKILEPFYKHNVNLLAAQNLAAMATSDQFGTPLEMKMLWDMLKEKGDLSEGGDILTSKDIKDYLEDKYGYTPLSADLRHTHSAWEGVSMALERAGLTDLSEAINSAWKKPVTAPQAVGQFPMSADIESGDQDAGDELFQEFNQEISELDYEGGGASDEDIDEMADQYFHDHYSEAVEDLAADYKRENRDEYDTILNRLAEAYAETLDLDEYLEKNDGDEDLAKAQMLVDAREAVEDQAEDEFDEHAREMVDDDASEQAQESAHDAAVEYYNEYGGGSDSMEDNAKAKVDIMNTLGSIMQHQHGVTVDACQAFFNTIHEEPNDEYTANAVDLHEYIAGAASHLIGCWASSSDGHNAVSNAMQILVSDLFPDVPRWDERPEHMDEGAFDQGKDYVGDPYFRAVAEPFLRAMYEHTQSRFREAGVEHIVISRGIKDGHGDQIQDAINEGIVAFGDDTANQGQGGFITGTHPIIDNPMSSWSWSPSTSEGFASNQSVVFAAKVPVERVIGTFRTGYGCMEEEEAVVLGGGGLARWYYKQGMTGRDNRPTIVGRALSGDPTKVEAVLVNDYNDYKLKGVYKPGRIYDANQGKMIEGALNPTMESHNRAAEEYNKNYNQKKAEAAVKAGEAMAEVGVDLAKHPGMHTYLSNVLHQITDDNHAYITQTKSSLTGHGATKEQAEKLYDKIVSLTKNDTTVETQTHHIAMHGSISSEKAKEVYEYLKPFKNAPPSVQNNEGYATQHIQGLIKQFGMGGYAATNIINHIQATPGMFKDNDYAPSLPMTTQQKINLVAQHGVITKAKAKKAWSQLEGFVIGGASIQNHPGEVELRIKSLMSEYGGGLTEAQATKIVHAIVANPDMFKSAGTPSPTTKTDTAKTSPKTPVPMIPKIDSSGPTVESKVKLFMASGGMSKVSAEAAHQALQTFMQSPPHIQNNKQQQQANIDDLVQYEGLTKYQATQIVSLIKDKPELFKSETTPSSQPKAPKMPTQVNAIASHLSITTTKAADVYHDLKSFIKSDLEQQTNPYVSDSLIHGLKHEHGLSESQAKDILNHIINNPELYKSAAVEGSSRLQKALAWTADLARRLGH